MCNFTQSIICTMHIPVPNSFYWICTQGRNFMDSYIKILTDKFGIHNTCVWKEQSNVAREWDNCAYIGFQNYSIEYILNIICNSSLRSVWRMKW